MRNCPKCNFENEVSSTYCGKCGFKIERDTHELKNKLAPLSPEETVQPRSSKMIRVGVPRGTQTLPIATPMERLRAAIIDSGLLLPALAFQAAIQTGLLHYGNLRPWVTLVVIANIIVVVPLQWFMLTRYGQTFGKRYLKIKIVRMKDGENGGFVTNVLLRSFSTLAFSYITLVGLADILFIFQDDNRCIHDYVAGTCVVKSQQS